MAQVSGAQQKIGALVAELAPELAEAEYSLQDATVAAPFDGVFS